MTVIAHHTIKGTAAEHSLLCLRAYPSIMKIVCLRDVSIARQSLCVNGMMCALTELW